MIREDRLQLNNRFIKVFNLLQERGDIIMNDRNGKGMGDFAEKILGNRAYGHIVRAFLNSEDKRVIDYRHARSICREYGVNESYLIDGVGSPFGLNIPKENVPASIYQGNILYTSVQAFAGSGVDVGGNAAPESHHFFSVPGVSGSGMVAFPVEGSSMEPQIKHGDTVICRPISGAHEIKDNEIYAVKSNGSLWVKHVQRIYDARKRVVKLKMISANHMDFDPFEEDVNEHTRLFKVIRLISEV